MLIYFSCGRVSSVQALGSTRTMPASHLLLQHFVFLILAVAIALPDNMRRHPNVVLIMADDLGYGDIGCFGNTTIQTPHLDKLTSQGVKLTQNIAAYTMCTPSRAAFLTGRYPIRSGMVSSSSSFIQAFIFTASAAGLPANETTIAEIAKKAGYQTAYLGKWHQGWSVDRSDPEHHHPLNQGFDYFYGIPLTNMADFNSEVGFPWFTHILPHAPYHLLIAFFVMLVSVTFFLCLGYVNVWLAIIIVLITGVTCGYAYLMLYHIKLLNSFMFRNYEIVEQPVDLASVTQKLVKESEAFIQARHQDSTPFLLLLSWLHMHTALATGSQFRGHSSHGPYGDAVEEMDWGVGQVLDILHRYGMDHNTFVYFTSDHGGAPKMKDRQGRTVGGYNGPFTGAKAEGSTEGSFRVPGIIRWPAGGIVAGQSIHEPVSLMDVLPTVADMLDVPTPDITTKGQVVLDGISLLPLLTGQEMVSPHEFLFHYCQDSVHAIRYRPRTGNAVWKLMLRKPDQNNKKPVKGCLGALHLDPPELYELTSDPIATLPLDLQKYSHIVSVMQKALQDHQNSIEKVPSQFTPWMLMWNPWNQPCCSFPKCSCDDNKFKGLFLE